MLANVPTYADAAAIAQKRRSSAYRNGRDRRVYLLNNEFKSVMAQKLSVDAAAAGRAAGRAADAIDYIYEQPPAEMLAALLPRYVEVGDLSARMLETMAAEHAARMTAMDTATRTPRT